jgi:hypothetical protein
MSFRTAYNDLKRSSNRRSPSPGYLRDPSPEEWKRTMDEYYKQQQKRKNGY